MFGTENRHVMPGIVRTGPAMFGIARTGSAMFGIVRTGPVVYGVLESDGRDTEGTVYGKSKGNYIFLSELRV